jgi:hypothetical protein
LEVLQYVGGTLGRIGSAAIPALVKVLANGDVLRVEVAARALGMTGEDGVHALSQLMPTIDDRLQLIIATILFSMGANAAPAVAGLAQLLDAAHDAEAAMFAAMALFNSGKVVVPVMDALVRRVADFDLNEDPAASWCRLTLSRLRFEAMPLLEQEADTALGRRRERLQALMTEFSPGLNAKTAYLDKLDEAVIRNFVRIGTVLESGSQKSIRELARVMLKSGTTIVGATNRRDRKWNEGAIRRILDDIDGARGEEMTVARGRNVEIALTRLGREALVAS